MQMLTDKTISETHDAHARDGLFCVCVCACGFAYNSEYSGTFRCCAKKPDRWGRLTAARYVYNRLQLWCNGIMRGSCDNHQPAALDTSLYLKTPTDFDSLEGEQLIYIRER